MKSIFMRVLFCKIHCSSLICFCKPSAAAHHLYTSGPLKLDNVPHVLPLEVEPVNNINSNSSSDQFAGETVEVNDESCLDDEKLEQETEAHDLKSCIRNKKAASDSCEVEKKKVQWVDKIGKELADIREFESSEIWDNNYDEDSRGCVCVIL